MGPTTPAEIKWCKFSRITKAWLLQTLRLEQLSRYSMLLCYFLRGESVWKAQELSISRLESLLTYKQSHGEEARISTGMKINNLKMSVRRRRCQPVRHGSVVASVVELCGHVGEVLVGVAHRRRDLFICVRGVLKKQIETGEVVVCYVCAGVDQVEVNLVGYDGIMFVVGVRCDKFSDPGGGSHELA